MPESVKDRPTHSHEYIFLFSKSEQYYYDAGSMTERTKSSIRNKRTVWRINTAPSRSNHLAPFPIELIEPCILAGSQKNEWVLDPFFGSGTTGIVSEKLGRKFVGIELHPEYAKSAEGRLWSVQSGTIILTKVFCMVKFDPPSPILQISFFKHLQALKDEILLEGLLTTIKQADTSQLDKELHQFVPEERLRTMRSMLYPERLFLRLHIS